MAKTCEVCGKTKSFGNTVTFSHKRLNQADLNIRRFAPSLTERLRGLMFAPMLTPGKVERQCSGDSLGSLLFAQSVLWIKY